jgi:hypothetical protein
MLHAIAAAPVLDAPVVTLPRRSSRAPSPSIMAATFAMHASVRHGRPLRTCGRAGTPATGAVCSVIIDADGSSSTSWPGAERVRNSLYPPARISQIVRLYRWFVGAVSLIVTTVPLAETGSVIRWTQNVPIPLSRY